jgi:Secretion system C-terminal sorting domain
MKRFFTLLSFFLISNFYFAQPSVVLLDEHHDVISNTLININMPIGGNNIFEIPVVNTSTSTKSFKVLRTYVDIDATDMTQFCWAGQCYSSSENLSTYSFDLPPGDTVDFNTYIFDGDPGWGFHAIFAAGTECVDRTVRYRFFDINNVTDSTGVTFKYLCSTGINESKLNNAEVSIFPSPANGLVTVDYKSFDNTKPTLVITDVLGNQVRKTPLSSLVNTEKMDVSTLPSGIYFYNLLVNNKPSTTKKLVISQK